MKMHEPIGPEHWGPFFVRVTLGAYVGIAGYNHLQKIPEIVEQVKKLNILPEHAAQLYAMLLPYLAILAGTLLIIGMWTTLASIITTVIIGSFVFALKEYPRSLNVVFDKDIILLAASLSLLYSGSGAMSVDRFRKSG